MSGGNGGSYGSLFMNLKPWDERKGNQHSVGAVINNLFGATAGIKGAKRLLYRAADIGRLWLYERIRIPGAGSNRRRYRHFNDVTNKFLAALNQRPEIQYATSFFNINFPQFEVEVNVAKCKESEHFTGCGAQYAAGILWQSSMRPTLTNLENNTGS